MHRPVLVTPPAIAPVSLQEAKAHLRVDFPDENGVIPPHEDDTLITGLIEAAVSHLDGWTGILGRCLVEQEWRQDFDRFARCLPLPLGPVLQIKSVTWRTPDGTLSTIATSHYSLVTDAGGQSMVRFKNEHEFPAGPLHESRAVAVTYVAGYETIPEVPGEEGPPVVDAVPAQSTVPAALKAAILLMVGNWYENRDAVIVGTSGSALPMGFDMLISPYRRISI